MSAKLVIKEMRDGVTVRSLEVMQIPKEPLIDACGVYKSFREEFGDEHEFSIILPEGVDWRIAKIVAKCLQRLCSQEDDATFSMSMQKRQKVHEVSIRTDTGVLDILRTVAAEKDAEVLLGILRVADKDDIPALGKALFIVVTEVLVEDDGAWLAERIIKDAAWDVECMSEFDGSLHQCMGIQAVSRIMNLGRYIDDMREALKDEEPPAPAPAPRPLNAKRIYTQSVALDVVIQLRKSTSPLMYASVNHLDLNKDMLQEPWACRAMSSLIVDVFERVKGVCKTL